MSEQWKRIAIDLPCEEHKRIKMEAVQRNKTITDFVLSCVANCIELERLGHSDLFKFPMWDD